MIVTANFFLIKKKILNDQIDPFFKMVFRFSTVVIRPEDRDKLYFSFTFISCICWLICEIIYPVVNFDRYLCIIIEQIIKLLKV